MKLYKLNWLHRLGIGGRLFLAFVLISSITILVGSLSTNTHLNLRDQLHRLSQQDIPGLDAATKLNDISRLIVATAPVLVTADSNTLRRQAMSELNTAISKMDRLMSNLPGYDHYFRELIAQINNSLNLLNQSVERRELLHQNLLTQSQRVYPLFLDTITQLKHQPATVTNNLYYFAGMLEKISNDSSFNELDYTFIRLEKIAGQIRRQLSRSENTHQPQLTIAIERLLQYGDRSGPLFSLQNEQLDLRYQQSFLLQNSHQHIQQLARQVNLYSAQTNTRISNSLQQAITSINSNIQSNLLLSVFSLLIAGAISWFYVRRNVLQRILELQHNMRSIACAKLDTKIRIIGNDEVSSMARDLTHFQKTAIAVEQTNRRLEAEIQERILAEQQLKSTQNELIQAAKLAALGQLSVGITHEISQPLTAIASHLHIAELRIKNNQLDDASHSHQKIKYLLNKITLITRHLKSFARKAGTELLAVNLAPVITDAIDLMTSQLQEHNCQLDYIAPSHPILVLAEPIRLEQVLINLLSNAIDAIKPCQSRQIKIKVVSGSERITISVQDSGIGIAADQLDSIFDPFYSHKQDGEGLGLGLSISYNIVQDFGGQIKVSSELGRGSCFTLSLQLAEAT